MERQAALQAQLLMQGEAYSTYELAVIYADCNAVSLDVLPYAEACMHVRLARKHI